MSQPPQLIDVEISVEKTKNDQPDSPFGHVTDLYTNTEGELGGYQARFWVHGIVNKTKPTRDTEAGLQVDVTGTGATIYLPDDHVVASLDLQSLNLVELFSSLGVVQRFKTPYEFRLVSLSRPAGTTAADNPEMSFARLEPTKKSLSSIVEDIDEAASVVITVAEDMRSYLLALAVFLKETDADFGPAYREKLKRQEEAKLLSTVTLTQDKLTLAQRTVGIPNGTRTTSKNWKP